MALGRSAEITITRRDVADLLAAIYALDLDEAAHLRALREVWSRPSLGGPLAVAIARRACPTRVGVMEGMDTAAPELPSIIRQVDALTSREAHLTMLRTEPRFSSSASELGRTRAMRRSRRLGLPDFLGFLAPTHTGFTVSVGAPHRNSRTAASLSRLSPLERRVAEATAAGTMTKVLALELGLSAARVSSISTTARAVSAARNK